jgi:hypothetical protein
MFILRLVALLLGLGLIASLCAWIFTRDRRYLALAWRLFRFAVYTGLIFFGLFLAERLLVPII